MFRVDQPTRLATAITVGWLMPLDDLPEIAQTDVRRRPVPNALKLLALIFSLTLAWISAETVGWNGAAYLFRDTDFGVGPNFDRLLLLAGIGGCAGAAILADKTWKLGQWAVLATMLYAGAILGVWNGYASGFDPARLEAVRHRFANVYILKSMSLEGARATCADHRIQLDADTRPFCSRFQHQ